MKRASLCAVLVVMALHNPKGPTIQAHAMALQNPKGPTAEAPDDNEGTPIANAAVRAVCGGCHTTDAKGRMSRISFRRTTPEGWQETIRRMVTLNKADVEPDQARVIVKYLSDRLGLAPAHTDVGELVEVFVRAHGPLALPDVLGTLATVVAKGALEYD